VNACAYVECKLFQATGDLRHLTTAQRFYEVALINCPRRRKPRIPPLKAALSDEV